MTKGLRSFISATDVSLALQLPGLLLVSWLMPRRWWTAVASAIASARQALSSGHAKHAEHLQRLLEGHVTAEEASRIVWEHVANRYIERFQLLRLYRPGGWRPRMELIGVEHLERALEAGNGVLLWISPTSFHSQVAKMAFCAAGYRVGHLSRYFHGFNTPTWFGRRFLNPIRTTQEERFLDQRLVIGPDGSKETVKRLEERLRANRIVSITVGDEAKRTSKVDYFKGKLVLATGPAFLSYRTKAPLLAVFTIRNAEDDFTVSIEPTLEAGGDPEAGGYIDAAVARYVALLESHALKSPGQIPLLNTSI